jgi:hypothetical protein
MIIAYQVRLFVVGENDTSPFKITKLQAKDAQKLGRKH